MVRGLGVWDLGFRGLGFRGGGSGFRGLGFRGRGLGVRGSVCLLKLKLWPPSMGP